MEGVATCRRICVAKIGHMREVCHNGGHKSKAGRPPRVSTGREDQVNLHVVIDPLMTYPNRHHLPNR